MATTMLRGMLCLAALAALSAGAAWAQQPESEVKSDAELKHADPKPGDAGHAGHTGEGGHGGEGAGHGHGHDEHIGSKGVSDKPEEFKGDLAIYTFVVFALLLAILWRFAWGPIVSGLEKREQGIAANIAAAERANVDARNMLAQYERKLAGSADEVRAILDEARRDAEHTQQEILAKARADAQTEKDRGIREIETATNQAIKQLAEQSANLAVELAGKIVKSQLNPSEHSRLVDEAMSRFPQGMPSKN